MGHLALETLFPFGNELQSLGDPGCLGHLFLAGIQSAVSDVGGDGSGKEHRLLGHIAYLGPQLTLGQVPEVHSIQGNPARIGVMEAQQQLQNGGFP